MIFSFISAAAFHNRGDQHTPATLDQTMLSEFVHYATDLAASEPRCRQIPTCTSRQYRHDKKSGYLHMLLRVTFRARKVALYSKVQ